MRGMKKLLLILALSAPAFADPALFAKYESVRQAFLANSLPAVQKSATELADAARASKHAIVAQHADATAKTKTIAKAREHFGLVSKSMLELHAASAKNARPAVYSCPMVKKSWLQPKGKIGNPYDTAMLTCGILDRE
jgi:hypothetical protein